MSNSTDLPIRKEYCISCIYMTQGETCCYCGNKNQTNESLKTYVYWDNGCTLFEEKKKRNEI